VPSANRVTFYKINGNTFELRYTPVQTLPAMIANLKSDPLKWYQTNKLDVPPALNKEVRKPEKVSSAYFGTQKNANFGITAVSLMASSDLNS